MLDLTKIGNKIKYERQRRNISQDALAETLYVSRQAVGKWENGLALPSIDNICLLVKMWDVPFEELLCMEEKQSKLTREQALSEILSGASDLDVVKELYRFSDDERMAILKAVKTAYRQKADNKLAKINPDRLWKKLSPEEKQFFDIVKYKEDKINEKDLEDE